MAMLRLHGGTAAASLLAWFILLFVSAQACAVQRTGFDHLTTGFELRGAHRDLSCEYCHVQGVFKGTPRTCQGCHTIGGRISATPKPPTHILTTEQCVLCHAIYNFVPVYRMDHTAVKGTCASCHNNVTAIGKAANHILSDNNCTACHTTVAFVPARMEHTDLLQKNQCVSCHDGIRASNKSLRHVPTSSPCGDCHTTLTWIPARFNHSGLTTNCQGCHNGLAATGKVANHLATARDCSQCHRYPNWTPLIFVHATPQYPGDHRGSPACGTCHAGGLDQASWTFAAYRPDCAGCHAAVFKPDAHPKTVNGVPGGPMGQPGRPMGQLYSVAELRNCTGACHVYADANMTAIAKPRPPGHHKVTDGAFH